MTSIEIANRKHVPCAMHTAMQQQALPVAFAACLLKPGQSKLAPHWCISVDHQVYRRKHASNTCKNASSATFKGPVCQQQNLRHSLHKDPCQTMQCSRNTATTQPQLPTTATSLSSISSPQIILCVQTQPVFNKCRAPNYHSGATVYPTLAATRPQHQQNN